MSKTTIKYLRDHKEYITRPQIEEALGQMGFVPTEPGLPEKRDLWQSDIHGYFDFKKYQKLSDAVDGLAGKLERQQLKDERKERSAEPKTPYNLSPGLRDRFEASQKAGTITLSVKEFPYLALSFDKRGRNEFAEAQRVGDALSEIAESVKKILAHTGAEVQERGDFVHISQPDLKIADLRISKGDPDFLEQFLMGINDLNNRADTARDERPLILGRLEEKGFTYGFTECASFAAAQETPVKRTQSHIDVPYYDDGIIPLHAVRELGALLKGLETEAVPAAAALADPSAAPGDGEAKAPAKTNGRGISHHLRKPEHPLLNPIPEHGSKKDSRAKADIVLDATALALLSTRAHEEGHSLLGLINHIAELPTVRKVVIDSVSADWELRGLVPDNGGLVDVASETNRRESEKKNTNFAELNFLLSKANRVYYDEKGTLVKKTPGEFSHIDIYDSAAQREALAPLLRIYGETQGNDRVKSRMIHEFRQTEKNDEHGEGGKHLGERAMQEYVASNAMAKGIDAYLVSDEREFRESMRQAIESRKPGLSWTQKGGRLNVMNTATLIESLGNDRFGVTALSGMASKDSPLQSADILQQIDTNTDDVGRLCLKTPREWNGKDFMGHAAPLGVVLSEGAAQAAGMDTEIPIPIRVHSTKIFGPQFQRPVDGYRLNPDSIEIPPSQDISQKPAPVIPAMPTEGMPELPAMTQTAPPSQPPEKAEVSLLLSQTPQPAASQPSERFEPPVIAEPFPAAAENPALPSRVDGAPLPSRIQKILERKESTVNSIDEESFGWRMTVHRNERKWTEAMLSDAVNMVLQQPASQITDEHIFQWSFGGAVPNEKEFKALAQLLISENSKVEDKDTALKTFEAAYHRTKEELKKSPEKRNDIEKQAFARQFFILRNRLGILDEELVTKVNASFDETQPTPAEQERLANDRLFMARIERGAIEPSPGLMTGIIRALDEISLINGKLPTRLSGEDRSVMEELQKEQTREFAKAFKNPFKPGRSFRDDADQYTPELRAMQAKLQSFFRHETGEAMTQQEIADLMNAHQEREYPIYATSVGNLISTDRKKISRTIESKIIAAMADYLRDTGKPEQSDQFSDVARKYQADIALRIKELAVPQKG